MLNWIAEELKQLEQQSLTRQLRVMSKPLINFSSNDYLGLSQHPRVIRAAQDAAARYGTGATSSRLLAGTTELHQQLETRLASACGTEAALVFPSGYMANLAVVTSLVGNGDAVILDRLCHASLVDAARLSGARVLVYKHADASDAERVLKRAKPYRRRLLITESLFSMDGDFAPFPVLSGFATQYDAMMLVDEAHSFGVSSGDVESWRRKPLHASTGIVVTATLSKALGSQGGFVAGSKTLIEWLVNRARSFIFTTGLAPANVAAALAALEIAETEVDRRERLQARSSLLRKELKNQGWNILNSESQIIPVTVGSADAALALAQRLEDSGLYAPAIRPPTVHAGECRLRFSVMSEHSEKDIEVALKVMSSERVKTS